MNNRRLQYEERASASPLDYDNWFDYLRLEESAGDLDRTREVCRGRHRKSKQEGRRGRAEGREDIELARGK